MLLRFGILIVVLAGPACQGGAKPASNQAPDPGPSSARAGDDVTTADDGIPRWPASVEGNKIRVRVARTRTQHFKGLSGVKLWPDEGMFFMYGPKIERGFWMKGCIIGLDIAWLTDDLKILRVDTLQAPGPETTDVNMPRASSPEPVKFVLEMPAGWFARHSIGAGARVSVPAALLKLKAE